MHRIIIGIALHLHLDSGVRAVTELQFNHLPRVVDERDRRGDEEDLRLRHLVHHHRGEDLHVLIYTLNAALNAVHVDVAGFVGLAIGSEDCDSHSLLEAILTHILLLEHDIPLLIILEGELEGLMQIVT